MKTKRPPGAFRDEEAARGFVQLVDDLRAGSPEVTCKFCGRISTVALLKREATERLLSAPRCPECDEEICLECGCTTGSACACGCTTGSACAGGCYWVEPGKCSAHPEEEASS